MIYKLLEDVFLKKDPEKIYIYSLRNEDLVVITTGVVSETVELLKKGIQLPEALTLWGTENEKDFQNLYDKLTSMGLTAHSQGRRAGHFEGSFKYNNGTIQFSTFDQLLPTKNVEVYASYCATNSCSYCDNCSCSDC